jgi:putative addiction module antidote
MRLIMRILTDQPASLSITNVITLDAVMHILKLTQIGNSVGVVLPKEALARLKVAKGETVFLTETPDGYTLTPYDPALEEEIRAGRELMHDYRDTFHQLAK